MSTTIYDEYEVIYDWNSENEEDLKLFASEYVKVVRKNDHGWWLGMIERNGIVFTGYFPMNYIKETPRTKKNAPKPPPRPISLPPKPPVIQKKEVSGSSQLSMSKVTRDFNDLKISEQSQTNSIRSNSGPLHNLHSISVFDESVPTDPTMKVEGPPELLIPEYWDPQHQPWDPQAQFDHTLSEITKNKSAQDFITIDELLLLFQFQRMHGDKYVHPRLIHHNETPLIGRQAEIKCIIDTFQDRQACYLKYLQSQEIIEDRIKYKTIVLVGLPGSGKTRLLESFPTIMQSLGIENYLSLIVPYFNGHSPTVFDAEASVECSFSLRLLYRFFFETINAPISFNFFMTTLRKVQFNIELKTSILAIYQVYCSIFPHIVGKPCSFFLGIDEFQALSDENLNSLLVIIYEASIALQCLNLFLFPIMAGTEWGKIKYVGSSNVVVQRISLSFFDSSLSLTLSSLICSSYLASSVHRSNIYQLGGIPRYIIEYSSRIESSRRLKESPDQKIPSRLDQTMLSEDMKTEKNNVLTTFQQSLGRLISAKDLIKLVAFSISQTPVVPDQSSGVSLPVSPPSVPLTWQQLSNRGIIMLKDLSLTSTVVLVPFYFLQTCGNISSISPEHRLLLHCEKVFLSALRKLLQIIDDDFEVDPWKAWEKFGAYYYALKLNAFYLIGITEITLNQLFSNGQAHPSVRDDLEDVSVEVNETIVIECDNRLDRSKSPDYVEKGNITNKVNLFNHHAIFINAECGKGVDIFFALKKVSTSGFIIVLDQRKKEATKLTQKYVNDLVDLMRSSIPPYLMNNDNTKNSLWNPFRKKSVEIPAHNQFLFVIFSTWGIFGANFPPEIPRDTIIFGWKEIRHFLRPFNNHPSVTGMVDVNVINQSLLMTLLNIDADAAKWMIQKKEEKINDGYYFKSFQMVKDFFASHGKEVNEENIYLLFFLNDYLPTTSESTVGKAY